MDSVLSFLIDKLSAYVHEKSELLGGLGNEVVNIKDELGQMRAFLENSDLAVEESPELQEWARQVRDVAYDVEDILDEFILRCEYNHISNWSGRIQKIFMAVRIMRARHQVANEIKDIKNRISNISETRMRYQSMHSISGQGTRVSGMQNPWYDRRGDALLLEESDLVGLEKPKLDIILHLISSDYRRNVIAVVGMGGLGKSTLVKKVYDDLVVRSQFSHLAWITFSESFNLQELLRKIISQLFKGDFLNIPEELDTIDINSLKQLLHEFLGPRKYFVVLDDLWQPAHWDIIQMAFPRNNFGSRVMITTRNVDVGQASSRGETGGTIYHLKPLANDESWKLFCTKAFNGTSCPEHLKGICLKILKACEGLPLAIVVIGSILASKSRRAEEWDLFYRSLNAELESNCRLEPMMKLLSLSYYNLPNHLRLCFLYLSIFPEDALIEKMRLVRLWMAEGLVRKREGMTIEEVAEGYIIELVNRSLLQVSEVSVNGRLRTCRVHDIIRQIILRKAKEQNILSVFSEGVVFQDKVRRLIIQGSINDMHGNNYNHLRSLVLFHPIGFISKTLLTKLLSDSRKLIKVLDMRGAQFDMIPDGIFELSHLRYLSLRKTKVKSVQKSIGKFINLETLDLKSTYVTQLPVEILKLKKLRHLLVYRYKQPTGIFPFSNIQSFRATFKIGTFKFLQRLCHIDASQARNVKIVEEIGKLTKLRRLGITNLRREDGKELCSSLEKLPELRSLIVVSTEENEILDLQYSVSSTSPFLDTLQLTGRLDKMPLWVSSAQGLTRIILQWSRLNNDPLESLQDLPNLMRLTLDSAYEGEELCFKAGGFRSLKQLSLWRLHRLRWVRMEEGALPSLNRLWMTDCASMKELPTGIVHLMSLQHIRFREMSSQFVNALQNLGKQSPEFQRIVMISQVEIGNWADGRWENRTLNRETGMFINMGEARK